MIKIFAQEPLERSVSQDMSRPLSQYWTYSSYINTCHGGSSQVVKLSLFKNNYIQDNVKAYEVVMRMGVRFIEIDILDGTIHDDLGLVPLACNGTTRLDLVTEKDSPAMCQVGQGSQRDQTARVY